MAKSKSETLLRAVEKARQSYDKAGSKLAEFRTKYMQAIAAEQAFLFQEITSLDCHAIAFVTDNPSDVCGPIVKIFFLNDAKCRLKEYTEWKTMRALELSMFEGDARLSIYQTNLTKAELSRLFKDHRVYLLSTKEELDTLTSQLTELPLTSEQLAPLFCPFKLYTCS